MREILFRGKREDNGEWVYGFYYTEADTTFILHHRKSLKTPSMPHSKQFICVDPETVGEYTGLKDSAGKMIFEGDIVQFTYWWFDGHENDSILTGEMVYLPGFMSFGLRGVKNADWIRHIGGEEGSSNIIPFAFLTFDEADFEIIGNVHDTPELLDRDKDVPL
jgi:uncharacterized phage protein (TIGR01671 family)